ncbi:MAG: hypothetical protein ACYSW0_17215 [Planctomycetota bacterium]|jgi:hypothetical protein
MVEIRTYKTGLRAPATLVTGISSLVRERQVLRFFKKHGNAGFDSFLDATSGLSRAPCDVKKRYQGIYKRWSERAKKDIDAGLHENIEALEGLKGSNPGYHNTFTRKDVAPVSNTASPDPALISLHDYCRLAGESFKMACATINTIAMEAVGSIPGTWDDVVAGAVTNAGLLGNDIKEGSLRKYPEKAIAHYLGRHGNIELTAFEQAAAMMQVHEDTCGKVDETRNLLFSPDHDFYNAHLSYLFTYSVPRSLLYYLSSKWSVERNWVRNTLVGWRRKIDPLLPAKCRVEPLVAVFSSLATHVKGFAKDEDQVKVIGILERKRVLHLLPRDTGVDLAPLLDAKYRDAYHALRERIDPWPGALQGMIDERVTSFSKESLLAAIKSLEKSVRGRLAGCDPGSRLVKASTWFLKNVEAIPGCINSKTLPLFQSYLPGNKYTGSVAKLLPSMEGMKENGRTNLFTALRGIVTLAFASLNANAPAQLERALVPASCVTRPYMSSNRKKKHLPANLLFNKYVVERKTHPCDEKYLNNVDATGLLCQGKPIWLGIPIHSPDQFNKTTGKLEGTRKGIFWFQLVPTGPIIKRLQKGARLESIRLNVPSGPARKIVADLTLSAEDHVAFARNGEFIKGLDNEFGKKHFPRDDYISNDLNKLGEHAIAIGTASAKISLVDEGNLMATIVQKAKRIDDARKEIGLIQGTMARDDVDPGKAGRQAAQVTLLHKRVSRLHEQAERELLMVYLYCMKRTGATHAGWDSVAVETKGKRGTLAKAITFMPKKKGLMAEFKAWARDLKDAGTLPRFEKVVPVSPYTSQACDACFAKTGKQSRTRSKETRYHEFKCTMSGCPSKGTIANRHEVSARVSAIMLKQQVENAATAGT